MKKVLISFVSMALICLMAACSSGAKQVNLDVKKTASKLSSDIKYQDQLTKLEEANTLKVYNVQKADVTEVSAYISTGATAEEISVWKAKDADANKRIKTAVEKRIEAQKSVFTDYNPKEMTKLKNPVLVSGDNYVILCISDENDKAKSVIDSFIK